MVNVRDVYLRHVCNATNAEYERHGKRFNPPFDLLAILRKGLN